MSNLQGSFRYGLEQLPKALAEKLGGDVVKTGWKLVSLQQKKDAESEDVFILSYETPEGLVTVKVWSNSTCNTYKQRVKYHARSLWFSGQVCGLDDTSLGNSKYSRRI